MSHLYHEAVESKHLALAAVIRAQREGYYDHSDFYRGFGVIERNTVKDAECFYWVHDIAEAVRGSSETLPNDTTISPDALPCRCGWFWFGEKNLDGIGREPACALAWSIFQEFLTVIVYHTVNGEPQAQDSAHYRIGWPINNQATITREGKQEHNDPEEFVARAMLKFILAAGLWVRQRVLTISKEPLQRHARKRLARLGIEAPDVSVVMLRAKQSEHGSGDGTAGNWTCQWIMREH